MTWHQWQAEYPMDKKIGTPRRRASSNASSDHGHQSTGFSWCCKRYGEVSWSSRFVTALLLPGRGQGVEGPWGSEA